MEKQYRTQLIDKACQDPTGAGFFNIIKQIEPKLNQKLSAATNTEGSANQDNEAEIIAEKFKQIFGQKDVKPTKSERRQLKKDIHKIKSRMITETYPVFTLKYLEQTISRANIRLAKGPDGVSNRVIMLAFENSTFQTTL